MTSTTARNMWVFTQSELGRQIVIAPRNGLFDDWNHALQTNPTLFIHSITRASVATNQWVSLTHNQTNAIIGVGTGILDIIAILQTDGYNAVDGSAGISTTITTAGLVGKTITVKDGLITGFA